MPKFTDNVEMQTYSATGSIKFSGVKPEHIKADGITLVTIDLDKTGSVREHADKIKEMIKTIIIGCSRSSRSNNLMIRVVEFNSRDGIYEVHGFKLLNLIDIDKDYENLLYPQGMTNLYDASGNAIDCSYAYSENLFKKFYDNNTLIILVTDGDDNDSNLKTSDVKLKLDKLKQSEFTESVLTILIGLTEPGSDISDRLETFKNECDFDAYKNAGEMTPEVFTDIAKFIVAQSESQSSSLGSGGPSQVIAF